MSYTAQVQRDNTKRDRRRQPFRPRINTFNPHRDVACEQVGVPYGRVWMGGAPTTIVDAMGDRVVIGEAIEGLHSYEILPEGRADSFLEQSTNRQLDQDRIAENEWREENDPHFRFRSTREANRLRDARALGLPI